MSVNVLSSLALSAALHLGLLAAVGDAAFPARESYGYARSAPTLTVDLPALVSKTSDSGVAANRNPAGRGRDAAGANPVEVESVVSARPAEIGVALPDEFRERDFLPRSMVSVPAQAAVEIVVPFPDEAPDAGTRRAILALFVDDAGRVARVRVDESQLSGLLEEAAQAAFLQSRFRPAEKDGHPVKSLVRVEVTFSRPPRP